MRQPIEISPELQQWAELAGYHFTPGYQTEDGRALFWSDGGEVRIFIGLGDSDWFEVKVTDSDRLGPEYLMLASPSMAAIERYLIGRFGGLVRSRKNLSRLHPPFAPEELSAGFPIEPQLYEGVNRLTLVTSDGSALALSSGDKFSGTADLVELSHYLTATTTNIMASYLDPQGKPLFESR